MMPMQKNLKIIKTMGKIQKIQKIRIIMNNLYYYQMNISIIILKKVTNLEDKKNINLLNVGIVEEKIFIIKLNALIADFR